MSCTCTTLHKGSFPSEESYIDTRQKIHVLVHEKKFIMLRENSAEKPFLEIEYQCCLCKKIWILQVPDQAFRGGWHEKK